MDVLIHGMEMPKNHNYVTITIWPSGTASYGLFDREENLCDFKSIKAVSVPPHGRLIDADALHEELYDLEYVRENEWLDGAREARGVDAARLALLDALTIIPASEEG